MNLAGFSANFTYMVTTLLLVIGLYGMIGKRNLIKKLIGLSVFQTAIFLFYIHGAVQPGGTVPVSDRVRHRGPVYQSSASCFDSRHRRERRYHRSGVGANRRYLPSIRHTG